MSSGELDLDAIQAAAEKASEGPWLCESLNAVHHPNGGCVAITHGPHRTGTAQFIAMCDPPTVAALVGEVRALRTENQHLRDEREGRMREPLGFAHLRVPDVRVQFEDDGVPAGEGEPSNG